ncbi:MAG: DUF2791 family P-loop domain-containing protein [Bacteroidales bacterium]|nr:DUF2791 family P-loop domain-containing protein [Bacteroidales bacterium]
MIKHDKFGTGEVIQERYKGLELLVKFEFGNRWLKKSDVEFLYDPIQEKKEDSKPDLSRGNFDTKYFKCRSIIESLRLGTVSNHTSDEFIFGRNNEIESYKKWINNKNGNTCFLIGNYGTGKSHFLNYISQTAIKEGYAVASIEIDPLEAPFHNPKKIYSKLVSTFSYLSNNSIKNFRDFVKECIYRDIFKHNVYFRHLKDNIGNEVYWEWIEAKNPQPRPVEKSTYYNYSDLPGIYEKPTPANIYCYLISSLGWAVKEAANLKGLLLLFDEAESIDANLYYKYQFSNGLNFFNALIRTADNEPDLMDTHAEHGLDSCRFVRNFVPFIFKTPSNLKLLFAFTPSYYVENNFNHIAKIYLNQLTNEDFKELFYKSSSYYQNSYNYKISKLKLDKLCSNLLKFNHIRRFVKGSIELLDNDRFSPEFIKNQNEFRKLLSSTWTAFFGRHGCLTDIQKKAIPEILASNNVVLSSPTASGKTEAIIAPIAEQIIKEKYTGLSTLYIVPTRALANDLFLRISGPLREIGICVKIKHGDKPSLNDKLPDLLITTPESLDSLICRRPLYFLNVKHIILDEIHLIDNTYRGDQVRVLINRIKFLQKNDDISVHLLSATINNCDQMASRYADKFKIITSKSTREINYEIVTSIKSSYDYVKNNRFKKVLYFCNKRETVEHFANEIKELWSPYPVYTHHGNLEKKIREDVETAMKEEPIAACVATTTLEIGIDIGNVDLVVLVDIPWSISSMMQRIGRANRRESIIKVLALVSSEEETIVINKMFEYCIKGIIEEELYQPDHSVAVQQILSYLFQHPGGVKQDELIKILSPICSRNDSITIINHLIGKQKINDRYGALLASTEIMDMGEKGILHSNIGDSSELQVIDSGSGKVIGKIGDVFDETFVLAQRNWKIVSISKGIIKVKPFDSKAEAPSFKRKKTTGKFLNWLPALLR